MGSSSQLNAVEKRWEEQQVRPEPEEMLGHKNIASGDSVQIVVNLVWFSAFVPLQRCDQKFQLLRWYKCVENHFP